MSASVAPDALAVSRSVVRRRRRFSAGRLAAHAVLIATTLTILLPLLWIARTSIVSRRVAYLIPPDWAAPFNLDSWAYIFGDQNFIRFFVNSLGIGVGTALLSLLVTEDVGPAVEVE